MSKGEELRRLLAARKQTTDRTDVVLDEPVSVAVTIHSTRKGRNVTKDYRIHRLCSNCYFDADGHSSRPWWAVVNYKLEG